MAEGKRYYWLRLHDDFFDSKRIKKLRKIAGGDTYTIIYLKLQLRAIKTNGILRYDHLEQDFATELALDIDEEPDNVAVALNYLLGCGLAESSDGEAYFFPYAVTNTGSEGSSAKRVREYRERLALQEPAEKPEALHCNGEKEIEKRRERDRAREEGKGSAERAPAPAEDMELPFASPLAEAVTDWLAYKKERRESYKPTGLKSLITQLQKAAAEYGGAAVAELIRENMASGYQGITFDRLKKPSNAWPPNPSAPPKPEETITEKMARLKKLATA